jgi:uncharacterized membrane protein
MNTQRMNRGFVGAIAVCAFAVAVMMFPGVSEAHGGSHASSTASSTKNMGNKNVDAACMVEAIDNREDALMDAWADMSSSTMAALEDRRDALMDAWGEATVKERSAGVVKAWKEWRAEKKAITAEFRKDRKAAWDAFKKTAKDECKMVTPKDENLEKATSDSIAL